MRWVGLAIAVTHSPIGRYENRCTWAATRLADRPDGISRFFKYLGVVDVSRAVWITASGIPGGSTTRWRFEPFLPLSVGFGLIFWPPGGGYTRRVQGCPLPVNLLDLAQAIQEDSVQILPYSCLMPLLEASPAGHARAAAHLLIKVRPSRSNLDGSISQGMLLFSTKRIPVSAARSSMRGLLPLGFGGSSGRRGSITSHSSSVTSSLAIPSAYPPPGYVRRC